MILTSKSRIRLILISNYPRDFVILITKANEIYLNPASLKYLALPSKVAVP